MKTWTKAIIGIVLSFCTLFSSLGYAALTTNLSITGEATATPPEGIYITKVEVDSTNYGSSNNVSHVPYSTTVDSTVNIQSYKSGGWFGQTRYGTVRYKITVWNNTDYPYAYSRIEYQSNPAGYNGNQYLGGSMSVSVTNINGGNFSDDVIYARQEVQFYATYTISSTNIDNTDLKTLINYKFGISMESVGAVALDAALIRFGEILNDTTAGGAYETLVDKIDDKYDGANAWKANFIGNVVDAHNQDTETINSLFQGKLTLELDGVVTNVTVLIKRENIDGDTTTGDDYVATKNGGTTRGNGCEMTLYMTTDPLQDGDPVIYAAVFTCDRNADGSYGTWYMIGDKFVGTASIVGYEGEYETGSFDTGTWRSTGTTSYSVVDGYSYTVNSGQTIGAIISATDTRANNALQTRLTQAYDVLNGKYGSYAGAAIIDLQAAFDNAARAYTISGDKVTLKSGQTRAELIPLIKELDNALTPFKGIIGS